MFLPNDLFSTGIDIRESLSHLDKHLQEPATVVLAGSAVPILAGCQFRHTADIDFAILPPPEICTIIRNDPQLSGLFDFQAQGVIGLLVDMEDRLVTVDLGLRFLNVRRLSLMDWVVSKLASPKLDDVLNVKEVTLDTLHEVERNFHNYGGVSFERAAADLRYLISASGGG